MKKVLLAFVFLVFLSVNAKTDTRLNFRVMTLNMHGIPCIDKEKYPKIFKKFKIKRCPDNTYWSQTIFERFYKLTEILDLLHQENELPDVLLLQEAFASDIPIMDNSPLLYLLKNSPYPYFVQGPQARVKNVAEAAFAYLFHIPGIVDSGLVILSKYPIRRRGRKAFFKCRGTDCLANKGILYAQIQLPGVEHTIDIFNTHYQAGSAYDAVKIQQNSDSEDYVRRVRSEKYSFMQVYGGDFNFRNSADSFSDFIEKSRMSHAGILCDEIGSRVCRWGSNNPREWILGSLLDHQFISRTSTDVLIYPKYMEYGHFKYRKKTLSDHPYLQVDYDIQISSELK